MKSMLSLQGVLLVAALTAGAAPLLAQEAPASSAESEAKLGGLTFREYCRSCHGPEAKGDGPVAQYLTPKPANLTLIRQRNHGEFPADAVYAAIAGGQPVKGHGTSEMPVWGDAFLRIRSGQTEEQVKERIGRLVRYLESIQVPPAP